MNVEGSVHVIQLNRQAGNQTPMFVVTWSPYAAHHQSGTIPTVKCVGVESLRYFLRDAVGLSEKSIRDWVKTLVKEKSHENVFIIGPARPPRSYTSSCSADHTGRKHEPRSASLPKNRF